MTANPALETLKGIDLESIDFKDLVALVRKAFDRIQLIAAVQHPPEIFCRARSGRHLFNHREQISYNRNAGPSRCNVAGEPLFYASNSPMPLPFELRAKERDVITIGYWRSTRKLLFSTFGFSEQIRAILGTQLRSHAKDEIPEAEQDDADCAGCHRFFEEAFTQVVPETEKYRYKLTAAFARVLMGELDSRDVQLYPDDMFRPSRFDGVMFPAIAAFGNARNMAILPSTVDSCLELFRVEAFRVDTAYESTLDLVPLLTGFPKDDGTILWSGRFENEYDVQRARGVDRVRYTDEGFRVFGADGACAVGF